MKYREPLVSNGYRPSSWGREKKLIDIGFLIPQEPDSGFRKQVRDRLIKFINQLQLQMYRLY
jgi:hypothetical protein